MEYDAKKRKGYIAKPTKIGRYTFVGGGSYIMPGVTVGKGCVIGVNSVVTHDVPDYSIVIGSPARIVGTTKYVDKKYLDDFSVKQTYYDNGTERFNTT
jgi:acetyltransferase-like isoleucine patch superfamily enzyme